MVYRPVPTYQLDGSAFQGQNCMACSDAMLVRRATHGSRAATSRRIRARTGDTSGGLNLRQVHNVNIDDFGIRSVLRQPIDWDELWEIAKTDRGFILAIWYGVLRGTKRDCFRGNFGDNHAIWVNHVTRYGNMRYLDPGADGRYKGCPEGWQSAPPALLKQAAGALDLTGFGTGSYRPLGVGKAYALLAPAGT